ncbi:MAG: hypothetical protein KIT84_35630 [Labilithrix sp.]|nr:hypothetical protein [Labilithrix sp.]MCW5816384.1 hypothetical protein [Labilithrix sp.]
MPDFAFYASSSLARTVFVVLAIGCQPARSSAPLPAPRDATKAALIRADARAAYQKKSYAECGRLFADGEVLASGSEGDAYDAACCHALDAKVDAAFELLARAIERGYRDVEHLERDGDLAGLRADARWAALVANAKAAREAYVRTLNQELFTMYQEDQRDRAVADPSKIDWSVIAARDAARRERTTQIVAAGGAKAADDYFHAAMIFQHGDTIEDFQTSHRLALEAVKLDPRHKRAKWLAAASKDRELMNSGKPQLYGTQFRKAHGSDTWVLYDVDPSVTDEERAKWNVPPLAVTRKRVDAMNAAEHAK